MGGFGPPAGSPFANPGATGLPFAGVPQELQERVDAILETEPVHDVPPTEFSQSDWDRRPFTLWRFVGQKRGAVALAFVLVVLETFMVTAGPFLTGEAIDRGVIPGDKGALVTIAGIYVATVVLGTILSAARVAWTGRVGEVLMEALRVRIFSHFQRLSLSFFTAEKGGVLMTRMTSDIDSLTALFQEGLVNMFVQFLTLAIVTVVLFVVSPTLALVLFLGVVPVMLALTLWFRKASDVAFLAVRDRIADVMSDLQENLAGIRIVTATNRAKRNVVGHDNVLGAHRDANDKTAVIGAVYGPSTELLGYLAQALLLGLGGWLVSRGSLSVGELAAFFLYLTMFFAPIQQLVQLYNTYQQGRSAVRKLAELFATEPEVLEAPDAPDLPKMEGAIDLDHVTFGYGPEVTVLHDLTIAIAAGETVAFVGETGAGKSTVAKLVNRYYDPTGGSVRIDGHDLRDVSLASVRSQIGVVPQEPFLFAGSIRDNLAFAAEHATDEELWAAVDAVGLRDLVERQPAGLDQVIHERGSSLSSGERQLLALARAFLSQPRVLVLDEATSNLDLASETRIEAALDVVLEGRTAIIIAHRLATAMRADRIAVIHDGDLVELGSHEELVAANGRYRALYDTWTSQAGGAVVDASSAPTAP
ncbi:ABC transporter ATP-binding protein [Actinospongicola halichondriae]|uniref:ABC transporter ATP-binding protein n=1 Tax=Actinospongicola halichondriae TaxID=3236844 RepID=UPI003D3AECC8